jgi:hypothetical protein
MAHLQRTWDSIVDLQQGEGPGKDTDVHLICKDGLVPAHTVILAHVSPILNTVFISQVRTERNCLQNVRGWMLCRTS